MPVIVRHPGDLRSSVGEHVAQPFTSRKGEVGVAPAVGHEDGEVSRAREMRLPLVEREA